ncbi:MAG: DEAD/DEAH box helicase [Acidimicrobiaceae bacterium]|nr:DEAD/DEAH box helicase [Acidimicrobiaceae bacterium]MYG54419.1 DEAD/DEAH box helicase [Acidimicrobiaceae bacterium]MYJ98897.1 DEAD/DEAH box helicase [Acidimicrobiaceae bacterium]
MIEGLVPGLREIEWQTTYSTDKDDLVAAFYQPCLERSTAYWRAVGYFSSKVLALISPAIERFYAQNGAMRIVASPALSEADRAAIRNAYKKRAEGEQLQEDETVIACLRRYLDPSRLESGEERLRLQLLSGMIRDGLLDLRIAVRSHDNGDVGLYHEKIGVFVDAHGDYVTFNGSPNETWNGWVLNAESFALHRSWGPEAGHAHNERLLFQQTWEEQRPGVSLFQLNDAVTSALFERFPPLDPDDVRRKGVSSFRLPKRSSEEEPDLGLSYPEFLADGLRDYQQKCVEDWFKAGCRGTFALATGTGKTVIALTAARQFAEEHARNGESTLVLIVVPTKDLAGQWQRNARQFNFPTTTCNSDSPGWPDKLKIAISGLQGSEPGVWCAIVTADTMTGERWKTLSAGIDNLDGNLLVVGDEMHSLGTQRRLRCLPGRDRPTVGKVGLSATPRRHNDEHGTEELLDYFGEVLASIDIAEAIRLGALTPYTYNPVIAHLSGDEQEMFESLSREIGKAWQSSAGDDEKFYRIAGRYLSERTKLLSHAEEKTQKGLELVKAGRANNYQILYTGEGAHPLTGVVQINHFVAEFRKAGMSANKYDYQTSPDQRQMNLDMFRGGELDVLVAMKCLDEGIDIPEARRGVILASTQNPRQFVQRRGRLLRTALGKKSAELVDVLCLPTRPLDRASEAYISERNLVSRELTRALELAEAATNGKYAPPVALTEIIAAYDLFELTENYGNRTDWMPTAELE